MKLPTKSSKTSIPSSSTASPSRQKVGVKWLKEDRFNRWMFTLLSVLSLGILPLICFFYPNWKVELKATETKPEEAEHVMITIDKAEYIVKVYHHQCQITEEHLISTELNGIRYCASSFDNYVLLQVPEVPHNFMRFLVPQSLTHRKEIIIEERKILFAQYGPNSMQLPEANGLEIFIKHAFSPFFLFQYFAATVWFIEDYILYSILILLITFSAVIVMTQESIYNLDRLRHLAGHEADVDILDIPDSAASTASAIYDTSCKTKASDTILTPGDQFIVFPGQLVPCDAVLIAGRVVVDESMLTGESVPANKSPIEIAGLEGDRNVLKRGSLFNVQNTSSSGSSMSSSNNMNNNNNSNINININNPILNLSPLMQTGNGNISNPLSNGSSLSTSGKVFMTELALKRSGNILFSGTKVRACHSGPCIAVCYRTGFRSAKGQLVASLLNPKEGFMNFISDALVVIFCMVILTTLLYFIVALELANMGVHGDIIILRYFDAITIAVPPALTACLTVATAISIGRLKVKDIFVSDTTRVNWAGTITATSFDKTGTLTEDKLNFKGAYISTMSESDGCYMLKEYGTNVKDLPRICLETMATCHSLAILDVQSDLHEDPVGDPLELELVRASGWTLSMSENNKSARMRAKMPLSDGYYEILRHFEFTPERLRAATLLKRPNASMVYLVKGSPEIIQSLCDPNSIPEDVSTSLTILSKKGLRVIAMAYRECREPEDILLDHSQAQVESLGGILFLGLLTLSSPLKVETRTTIERLNRADIHINMITGDYIHTAIAVAIDCGILYSYSTTHNTLYIIDERESDGATVIIDAMTDQICNGRGITLEKLLDIASLTSIVAPVDISDVSFASKKKQRSSLVSSTTEIDSPIVSTDRNSLIPQGQLQLAVTGRGLISVYRNYNLSTFHGVIRYAKVFARTKPVDKKTVVDELQQTKEVDNRLLELIGEVSTVVGRVNGDDSNSKNNNNNGNTSESTPLLRSSNGNDTMDISNKSNVNVDTNVNINNRTWFGENGFLRNILSQTNEEVSQLGKKNEERGNFAVLFCGDGANDMAALRAATVGVSLCDTETSVAAPITSKLQTPSSVIDTIIEGRCSLITAYVLVLFNIMYGVIQLTMAIILYYYGLVAGDYMYLTQDLFYTLVLGLAISMTPPSQFFGKSVPPKRFITKYLMYKLVLQLILFVLFQLISLWILSSQSFYTRFETDDPLTSTYSYEATTIDTMCLAQLMIASVVSTIGEPFRKPWYQNRYHMIALLCQSGWLLFQIFGDNNYFAEDILDLEPLPVYFGFILLLLMITNGVLSWIANSFAETLRPNPYTDKMSLLGKVKEKLGRMEDKPLREVSHNREDSNA